MHVEEEPIYEASKAKQESSFSEAELDLQMEMQAGEWEKLKGNKRFQLRSRQGKIIAMYQTVSNRLNQLVGLYYKLVNADPHGAVTMLEELRKLRSMQEYLLQCLIWEPEGNLTKDMVPSDIWDMIK